VSALDSTGSTLLYSTYLGGSAFNAGSSIAWDSTSNSVYVVGRTTSTDFPTTQSAFQMNQTNPGQYSTFVTKFSSSGQITDSTFLGPATTLGFGVATDSQGRAYITGYTAYNCSSNPTACFPQHWGPSSRQALRQGTATALYRSSTRTCRRFCTPPSWAIRMVRRHLVRKRSV
jgi:Beta-propeller repeat